MTIKYQAKKKKDDYEITKTGEKYVFKKSEVQVNLLKTEKLEKELEAQISLDEAKMANYLSNYPKIKSLDKKFRVAVALYTEAEGVTELNKTKLKEVKSAIKDTKDDIKEIYKQTGIQI